MSPAELRARRFSVMKSRSHPRADLQRESLDELRRSVGLQRTGQQLQLKAVNDVAQSLKAQTRTAVALEACVSLLRRAS